MKNFLIVLKGMAMGIAEVIPGLSGSTVALLVGVYDDFISLLYGISEFVKSVARFLVRKGTLPDVKDALRTIDFPFAFPLLLGMGMAFVIFSRVILYLLEHHTPYTLAFLAGLIPPVLIILFRQMGQKTGKEYGLMVVSFVACFIILGLPARDISGEPNIAYVFLGGVIAISAMVLPGISGSFMLLILGLYEYVIGLVSRLTDFEVTSSELVRLCVFVAGVFFGFVGFIRLLRYLLVHYKNIILACLFGLVLASLRVLWPFVEANAGEDHELVFVRTSLSTYSLTEIALVVVVFVITSAGIIFVEQRFRSSSTITFPEKD